MRLDEERQTAVAAGLAVVLCGILLVVMVRVAVEMAGGKLLGHYQFPVAPKAALMEVDAKGTILLRRQAARAFLDMQKAAYKQGVVLRPISGFRDLNEQRRLFFAKAAQRSESLAIRSHVCAPPGYSEHHTGYSLDIGSSDTAPLQLERAFETTAAFRWLKKNAARFHFELSFPKKNRQSIAYEPWHWRYVGDMHAFRTFYKSRNGLAFASMLAGP